MFAPISREGALVLNNLILTTAAATVLVGTLYPLALEAVTGAKISVGPPFFNMTFGLLMLPLMLAVPFGPLLAWKRGDLLGAGQRLFAAVAFGLVAGSVIYYEQNGGPVMALFGIALGAYMIAGSLTELFLRSGLGKVTAAVAWRRVSGLPRSVFGTALAHAGIGVTLIGIVAVTAFETEHIVEMKPGMTTEAGGYTLRFDGLRNGNGPNYSEESGHFTISQGGVEIADVWSSKRFYTARQMPTTEAGIRTFGLSQLYVSLGDDIKDGGIVIRVWWKPMILCIWLGTVFMMAGGAVSLSDRRLRVGAPSRGKEAEETGSGAGAMIRRLLVLIFLLLSISPVFAVNPDEVLADPALETRARELSAQLRCMVCQNQSIDDSNAELAKDLRLLVRERITNGDSDDDVIAYVVSRYGEFVLLNPRFEMKTLLLWGAPVVLLLAGAAAMLAAARRRTGKVTGTALSADEQARLDAILKD